MKYSDETLMAYADGELGEPERSEIERALRGDAELAARVARHRALRQDVFGAFAGVLDEPVPARLRVVAGGAAAPAQQKVVQLDSARAARRAPQPERARSSWAQWGGMAAALVIGVFAGILGVQGMQGMQGEQLAALDQQGGALVAHGQLERALTQQLASAGIGAGAVQIGVSFVDKGGRFCRSFQVGGSAGLACREGAQWQLPLLAGSAAGNAGPYRQAGSAMPPAVLDAIDERIAGQALDANAERAAQQRGWIR
jgi:hypothetical protein